MHDGFGVERERESTLSQCVDWGTKILYLERSIIQPCHDFLESLDRLYQPELLLEAKKTNLEFI